MIDKPVFSFMKSNPMGQARAVKALEKRINSNDRGVIKIYEWIEGFEKGLKVETSKIHSSKSEKGYTEKPVVGDHIMFTKAEQDYYSYIDAGGETYTSFLAKRKLYDDQEAAKVAAARKIRDDEFEKINTANISRANEAKQAAIKNYILNGYDAQLEKMLAGHKNIIKNIKENTKTLKKDDLEEIAFRERQIEQTTEHAKLDFKVATALYKIEDGEIVKKYKWRVGDAVLYGADERKGSIETVIEKIEVRALPIGNTEPTYIVAKRDGIHNQYCGYEYLFPVEDPKFYTTAPESYDGFGTKTISLTEYTDRNGKPVREVSIPVINTDWQTNRNASGNYGTFNETDFNLYKDTLFTKKQPDAEAKPTGDYWETVYGNIPDIAAVYTIAKSVKKEVVVIKHKGKHYVIYADISGIRREKDITHIGEAIEWLKGVLTKMSDVVGDNEVDESLVKSRLTLRYGKDLLEVNKTESEPVKKEEDWLFVGHFPTGLQYADRTVNKNGDFLKIAFVFNEHSGHGYASPVKVESTLPKYKELITKLQNEFDSMAKKPKLEIKPGQVYLNTTTKKLVVIDTIDLSITPNVHYHIYKETKSYRNSNIDRLSLFEDLVESAAFILKNEYSSTEINVQAVDAEVYIEYLNKDANFKPMKKYFLDYEAAVTWGEEQFEKFSHDMIHYTKTPSDKATVETKTAQDFEGSQSSGTGKLYEYFTPMEVVEKMWALAYHYGKGTLPIHGMKVLDPAMGSGRLFTYAPKNAKVAGFEINKENEAVAMKYCVSRNFASIRLYNESFEIAFLNPPRYNSKLKGKKASWLDEYPFDLVVANPPYGKFTGLYKTHFNFTGQFEHFFIEYSMKLVKQGGLGVFVVPSSFLRNGNTYNSVKERIFNDSKLLDAYRLPANIFKHTQIGTDIIVLQKK